MHTRSGSGTAFAARLAIGAVLLLTAACETSSFDSAADSRESTLAQGTAPPLIGGPRRFPRPVPRPAMDEPIAPPVDTAAAPPAAFDAARGTHTVTSGQNVYDVAPLYGVDPYALVITNELRPPFDLYEGQVLVIPGSRAAAAVASRQPAAPSTIDRPSTDRSAVDRALNRPVAEAETAARPAAPTPRSDFDAPASKDGFIWPLQGRVVSGYGAKGNGRFNDGINIAAPEGTVVLAAESGVVAYAGNELRGFGRTLLIKHPGGWVTAYAHNSEILVRRGDRVRRGQAVARVGATGSVDEPQLHFEIRRGRTAVDPAELLPRAAASARHGRSEG